MAIFVFKREVSPKTWERQGKGHFKMILIQLGTKIENRTWDLLAPSPSNQPNFFWLETKLLDWKHRLHQKKWSKFRKKKLVAKKKLGRLQRFVGSTPPFFFGCTFWEGKVFCYGYVNLEPKWGLLFSLGLTFKNKGHWASRNF